MSQDAVRSDTRLGKPAKNGGSGACRTPNLTGSRGPAAPRVVPDDPRLQRRRIVEEIETGVDVHLIRDAFAYSLYGQTEDIRFRCPASDHVRLPRRLNLGQTCGF